MHGEIQERYERCGALVWYLGISSIMEGAWKSFWSHVNHMFPLITYIYIAKALCQPPPQMFLLSNKKIPLYAGRASSLRKISCTIYQDVKDAKCMSSRIPIHLLDCRHISDLKLPKLYSIAIDYVIRLAKLSRITRDLQPPKQPYIIEKVGKKQHQVYRSKKLLG